MNRSPMPAYAPTPNSSFLTSLYEVYSDVSGSAADEVFAWAYLILVDGKLTHLDTGRRATKALKDVHPESYSSGLAVKRLTNGDKLPTHLIIYTDCPRVVERGIRVAHDNPWHLVCHYAARDEAKRGRAARLENALRAVRE